MLKGTQNILIIFISCHLTCYGADHGTYHEYSTKLLSILLKRSVSDISQTGPVTQNSLLAIYIIKVLRLSGKNFVYFFYWDRPCAACASARCG
jgi:hypothetical protein